MDEVGSALIAIALVLCAVFVPSVFITGISGQFYRQFALTIAGATVISLIVSLTLSPAMCALLLKPHDRAHRDTLVGAADPRLLRLFQSPRSTASRSGISWLATRTVRRAAMMVVIYLVVLGFGLERVPQDAGRLHPARSTAAISSSWCSCRRAPRWRAPTRCSSARSISRSACRAWPTPSTSSASPAPPSPMRRIPARCSWCWTVRQARPRSAAVGAGDPGRAEQAACPRSRTPSSSRCCRRR